MPYLFTINIYNFYFEYFFLQIVILYLLFLIFLNSNLYYSVLYLFFQTIYFGICLSFMQVELFTGFLWTAEYIIIFVFTLMLFYLNAQGDNIKLNIYFNKYFYLIIIILFMIFLPLYFYANFSFLDNIYYIHYWDNFYESFLNSNMNDFVALYISYFSFNSLEYLIIGFLLFFGSVVCINLFRVTKIIKFKNYSDFFKIFKYTQVYNFSSFMRKQHFTKQANANPSVRTFKSKIMND